MLQKIILAIVIFIVILIALTFGEHFAVQALDWVSRIAGIVVHNFSDIYYAVIDYVSLHPAKVVIALLLTVPISYWIIKNKGDEVRKPNSQRKIAIVLAFFLGWLGAHRFYLGQTGWGIVYLIILYLFAPLAVVLGFIDALRYLFMTEESFSTRQR